MNQLSLGALQLQPQSRHSVTCVDSNLFQTMGAETEYVLTPKGTCPNPELHPSLSILHVKKAILNTRVDSRGFDAISFLAIRTCSWAKVWRSDLHYFS